VVKQETRMWNFFLFFKIYFGCPLAAGVSISFISLENQNSSQEWARDLLLFLTYSEMYGTRAWSNHLAGWGRMFCTPVLK
jgi:hypothetical protein